METALKVWEINGFVASFIIYSNIYDNFHSYITRLCKKGHAKLAESSLIQIETSLFLNFPRRNLVSAAGVATLIAYNALELC